MTTWTSTCAEPKCLVYRQDPPEHITEDGFPVSHVASNETVAGVDVAVFREADDWAVGIAINDGTDTASLNPEGINQLTTALHRAAALATAANTLALADYIDARDQLI